MGLSFFKDSYLFIVFEGIIFLILLKAIYIDYRKRGSGIVVKRGEKSSKTISNFGSAILALGILELTTSVAGNYKLLASTFNVGAFLYLLYLSPWFRNKIIGWNSKLRNREEHL